MADLSSDANKALVRRFVKEIFEDCRPGAVDELVADDFVQPIQQNQAVSSR